jgi:cysteinyl-tRNA synthetase
MPGIIIFIQRLIELEAAYETSDGVYFAVNKDPHYGELSRRNLDELRCGERVAVREEKRDPLDFALWKKAKPGEPTWESPWGPGRPGWHIECSAMCKQFLGDQFDIHGGATDLLFPHHENEVAQSETASGRRPMARYWVHAGLLQVDGQKMSKSLGNFIPLTDLLQQYPAVAARYLFLQTGYRKPSNFTTAALEAAAKGLRGLYADLDVLRDAAQSHPTSVHCAIEAADFDAFLDDDLNTAGALGWLQCKVRDERAMPVQASGSAHATVALVERCLGILGLPATAEAAGLEAGVGRVELSTAHRAELRALAADGEADSLRVDAMDDATLIDCVVAQRNRARASKDFSTSDRLRDALGKAGVALRDTKTGSEWSIDGSR